MSATSKLFHKKSKEKAGDLLHRNTINFNISKYNAVVPAGQSQFSDLDYTRKLAKNIKWAALGSLSERLLEFEEKFSAKGGKVIWAETASEAIDSILKICKEKNCKTLVKSKSMATEEIHLNHALQLQGIDSVETDLGEYIQQLDDEPPYHIVTPAMHKSKEDVAKLFHEKLGTPIDYTPEQLTLKAREILREKYTSAEVGVTGANFIISNTGSIALTENEGNARLTCAFPKTHIVLVGIEKVIPSLTQLSLFWPLLSSFGTGQRITSYSSIVSGPRQENETDGPEEMYVILLDNGRTRILENATMRESLYCIRCGACLNACPVYKNIGGHTYATTYSGPIGSVITPHLQSMENFKHLSFASSLCGNCTEVCAVKINLHELLLENRAESVEQGVTTSFERMAWKMWKTATLNRSMFNMGNRSIKNTMIHYFGKAWTNGRADLDFSKKTFNEMWKERNKKK